jgi:hypothetical protein
VAAAQRGWQVHCSTEAEQGAKRVLCARYLETLLGAHDRWREHGVGLLLALLAGVRDALRSPHAQHQALFKDVDCFVQVRFCRCRLFPYR